MKELLGQAVFSVGGAEYVWEDVVLAAQQWGDWARLRERVREGAACLRRMAEEEEEPLTAEEVDSAANEFRYDRDLISAEEMERWLERWGLTVESWMDSIRSSVLRQKWSGELAGLVSEYAPADEEIERLMQTEAVCSGELARLARELAGRAATFEKEKERAKPGGPAVGERESGEPSGSMERLAQLETSFRRFRDRVMTPEAVQAQIRSRQADWTQLDCQRLSFSEEETAREAALCVREDGQPLSEVAEEVNRDLRRERFYVEDAELALRDTFLGARKGELLGPFETGGEFVLYSVLDKVLPSKEDPAVVARAEETTVKVLVDREITDRVKWHWPV